MKRAVKKLKKKPNLVLIDGNKLPELKNYNLKYNQTQERIAVFYKYRIKVQPSSTTTKLDS